MSLMTMGAAAWVRQQSKSNYLDELSIPPLSALSLRRVISTASVAIRVRRSSDDAELDIGFNGDALDVGALLTFAGSGHAYVAKVYDQTGDGLDAEQAAAAKQPRIVNAGVFDGAAMFDGINDALVIPNLPAGTQFFGVYGRLSLVPGSNYKILCELSGDSGLNNGGFGVFTNNDNARFVGQMRGTSGGGRSNTYTMSIPALGRITALFDRSLSGADEVKFWLDGNFQTPTPSGSGEQSGNFVPNNFHIGARTASSLYADLILESLVLYRNDTAAVRSSIEAIVG